jgi:hypothetical protein
MICAPKHSTPASATTSTKPGRTASDPPARLACANFSERASKPRRGYAPPNESGASLTRRARQPARPVDAQRGPAPTRRHIARNEISRLAVRIALEAARRICEPLPDAIEAAAIWSHSPLPAIDGNHSMSRLTVPCSATAQLWGVVWLSSALPENVMHTLPFGALQWSLAGGGWIAADDVVDDAAVLFHHVDVGQRATFRPDADLTVDTEVRDGLRPREQVDVKLSPLPGPGQPDARPHPGRPRTAAQPA